MQKVLEHFGHHTLVLGSNVLDVPLVGAHCRGPHQPLHWCIDSLMTHRRPCIDSCNNRQGSFQLVTLKCECVTLGEGGGFRPFTVTSYPYCSKRWSPNWTTCFCYGRKGRKVIMSPTHPTELRGVPGVVTTAFEHTSFRWRKGKRTYKTTKSSEGMCGNQGDQIQRIDWFHVCSEDNRQFVLNNVS